MRKSFVFLLVVFLAFSQNALNAQRAENLFEDSANRSSRKRSAEAGFAEEEFRRGVQSYYRGQFNDAIMQFEKALSYLPDENLILDWLGKSYYRAGLEGTALEQWQFAHDAGYGGILLENKIEVVRERRVNASPEISPRYTETGSYFGTNSTKGEKYQVFASPTSVLVNSDGTIWVAAYGSNELVLLDINGNVVRRVTGPFNGFDRPLDVIRSFDGKLLVSESAGDRIAVLSELGFFEKYIGEKGRGAGQFVGPQYLAQDSLGNIYVTDFGNSRVVVFDKDGNGIFDFGRRSEDFAGLKGPTGIAIKDDRVFVADCVHGAIYQFDLSGNYEGVLVPEQTFSFPEALKFSMEKDFLVVSDRNRIFSIDLGTGAVFENAFVGNAPARITCALPDFNGNILASDFKNSEIYIMSRMTELLGGFYVEISRVNAEHFPKVSIEVNVQNRMRQPVIGLRAENFYISEGRRAVSNLRFEGAASANTNEDIAIIIDRNVDCSVYGETLNHAVRELAGAMQGVGKITLISSGEIPVLEYEGVPSGLVNFSYTALKTPKSAICSFDLALRMAANNLINSEPKRAVIFLTDGVFVQGAFARYGLSDLASYLNNNCISFSIVQLEQGAPAEEFDYICKTTFGKAYYVFRPEGLGGVIADLLAVPNGMYQFSYESSLWTDMGRAFLPVEVETYVMNRSGRDEIGYFAPLE